MKFTSKNQIGKKLTPIDKEIIQEAGNGANINSVEDIKTKMYAWFKAWLGGYITDEELVNSLKRKLGKKWFRFFKNDTLASDWQSIQSSMRTKNNREFLEENMKISLDTNGLEIYDVKGNRMAKGGATEHGLKKGDTIKDDMFWEDSVVVTGKNGTAKVNLDKGTRTELKKNGGALKANDIPLGAWLKHKKTGAVVKVWNVDPKLGKMQLERDGVKTNSWHSAGDWEVTTKPVKKAKGGYVFKNKGYEFVPAKFVYTIGGL